MEWYMIILLFILLLLLFLLMGMPIAFAFITVNIIFSIIFIGFNSGITNMVNSAYDALSSFSLTPIPMFILMGELLFHSGLVMLVIDAVSKVLGKIPSRLSILAVSTGTVLSAMSGSAIADSALLGSTIGPEMKKKGYHNKMIVGPILAGASLALIIPPSTTAVLLGSTARISVGDLLLAGILPGLLIAILTIVYFLALGIIKPELAPIYEMEKTPLKEKLIALLKGAVPVIVLIFLVLVLMFTGVVTPTESAASGALGALLLTFFYKKLSVDVFKKSIMGTVRVCGMILIIIGTSAGFSQILAYTGATRGLLQFVTTLDVTPIIILILMLLVVIILGTFMEPISIMMLTLPIYMPLVSEFQFDPIWFGIMMLISIGLGNITPPFGLLLFVMKAVMPDIKTTQLYSSVTGVIMIQLIVIILILIFPTIATIVPDMSDR